MEKKKSAKFKRNPFMCELGAYQGIGRPQREGIVSLRLFKRVSNFCSLHKMLPASNSIYVEKKWVPFVLKAKRYMPRFAFECDVYHFGQNKDYPFDKQGLFLIFHLNKEVPFCYIYKFRILNATYHFGTLGSSGCWFFFYLYPSRISFT